MDIKELAFGKWSGVMFGGFKTHFCPNELVSQLVADIISRGGEVIDIKSVTQGWADLPGMVLADRPWEDIQLKNFKLGFPSQDFEHFLRELNNANVRKFADGSEYYKLHGWLHCIILTPDQYVQVMLKMDEMLPAVRNRCKEADERMNKAREVLEKKKVLAPQPTLFPMPRKDNN